MINKLFLGLSLLGAEWVLYFLILLSIASVAIMVDRVRFYKKAQSKGFDVSLRELSDQCEWSQAKELACTRLRDTGQTDLTAAVADGLLRHFQPGQNVVIESAEKCADDALMNAKTRWERGLVFLAVVGSNAPFVGLFGTVLGIITAFQHLSAGGTEGMNSVMSGIAEALVATAMGLFVAIPAVVAYNFFQRRLKSGMQSAESLKNFITGNLIRNQAGAHNGSSK